MSITIGVDRRDPAGWGVVYICHDTRGEFRITFEDKNSYGAPNTARRVGWIADGDFCPVVAIEPTDFTAKAPRSKYQPGGGVTTDLREHIINHPESMLRREDFRLRGSTAPYYKDAMMSDRQWRDFYDEMKEVTEWVVNNRNRRRPVLDPYIQLAYTNATRNAERARDAWQRAETELLTTRDAFVADQERVDAALAALIAP